MYLNLIFKITLKDWKYTISIKCTFLQKLIHKNFRIKYWQTEKYFGVRMIQKYVRQNDIY